MDIVLTVFAGLIGAMAFSAWSCGRSYYEKGKVRGTKDAVRELQAGMTSQLGAELAPEVVKALADLHASLDKHVGPRGRGKRPSTRPFGFSGLLWPRSAG